MVFVRPSSAVDHIEAAQQLTKAAHEARSRQSWDSCGDMYETAALRWEEGRRAAEAAACRGYAILCKAKIILAVSVSAGGGGGGDSGGAGARRSGSLAGSDADNDIGAEDHQSCCVRAAARLIEAARELGRREWGGASALVVEGSAGTSTSGTLIQVHTLLQDALELLTAAGGGEAAETCRQLIQRWAQEVGR